MAAPLFERLMIDPPAGELLQTLAQGARAATDALATAHQPAGAVVPVAEADWQRLSRPRLRPQGVKCWSGNREGASVVGHLVAAWWTDGLSRRHVRVRSLIDRDPPPVLPPLAEVYPDRAVLRRRGKDQDVRVVCACGLGGDPAALGWMGESCGPCHDRREETGTSRPRDVFVVPADAGAARDVAFAPVPPEQGLAARGAAGLSALVATFAGTGRAWDLTTGECRVVWSSRKGDCHDLLAHPDGKCVVVEERQSRKVVLRNLETGRRTVLATKCPGYLYLSLSWDGKRLLIGGNEPRVVDLETHATTVLTGVPPQRAHDRRSVAFTPDGTQAQVATDAGEILRASLSDGVLTAFTKAPAEERDRPGEVAFSADGRRLVYSRWTDKRVFHVWMGDDVGWRTFRRDRRRAPCWLAMTPNAGAAVLGEYSGRLEIWDLDEGRCLGSLHGPRHSLTALTFSRDASLLAVATNDRSIRLWPWRQLLEG